MVTYFEKHETGKTVFMLLLGPLFGLIFIISLPFIVIATVIIMAGRKLLESTMNILGNFVSFGWRPTETYLAGKKKLKKKDKPADSEESNSK